MPVSALFTRDRRRASRPGGFFPPRAGVYISEVWCRQERPGGKKERAMPAEPAQQPRAPLAGRAARRFIQPAARNARRFLQNAARDPRHWQIATLTGLLVYG